MLDQPTEYDPQARWRGDDLKNTKSSIKTFQVIIAGLVWAFVILSLVSIMLGPLQGVSVLNQLASMEEADPDFVQRVGELSALAPWSGISGLLSGLVFLVLLVTSVSTAVWTGQIYHYFSLNGVKMSRPTWMAIAWFFVPVANLIVPFSQFLEIRQVSGEVARQTHPRMIFLWWLAAVAGPVMLMFGQQIAIGVAVSGEASDSVGNVIIVATVIQALSGAFMIMAAGFLSVFVNRCSEAVLILPPELQDSVLTE